VTTYVYRLPLTDSERHELAAQMRVQPDSLPPWRDVDGPEPFLAEADPKVVMAGRTWTVELTEHDLDRGEVLLWLHGPVPYCAWCRGQGEHREWCRTRRSR
jgi:hypothetical protein